MNTQSQQQIKSFKDLAIAEPVNVGMQGPKIDMHKLFGRQIVVHDYSIAPSKIAGKEHTQCLTLQISVDGNKRVVFSGSRYLIDTCVKIPKDALPFSTTIVKKDNDSHQFT